MITLWVWGFDWDGGTLRTKNGRRLIRPVTARFMHPEEIAAYEKESAKTQDR
jgi:hypothetical protein